MLKRLGTVLLRSPYPSWIMYISTARKLGMPAETMANVEEYGFMNFGYQNNSIFRLQAVAPWHNHLHALCICGSMAAI